MKAAFYIQKGKNLSGEQVLHPASPQAPQGFLTVPLHTPVGHLQPCQTINAAISALHKAQYADTGIKKNQGSPLVLNTFFLLPACNCFCSKILSSCPLLKLFYLAETLRKIPFPFFWVSCL